MKKQIFKQILEWVIVLLLLAVYSVMVIDVIRLSENILYSIGITVLGLIITLVLSSIIHELGHVIFGVIAGLKLRSFTILFLSFRFDLGRLPRIKFVAPIDFGSTEFLPKNRDKYAKKLFISAIGGLAFSLLYLAMGIAFTFIDNYFTYCVFGITFPITAYIILVNLIPFETSSDGYLVFSWIAGGKIKRIIENSMTAIADVYLGVEPKDLDSRLLAEFTKDYDIYSVRIIYLRYLAYFRRDGERAIQELLAICDSQRLNEEFYILVFKELFYNAILKKDDAYIKANQEEAVNYLSYEMHPIDYRIHASYRAYIGDLEWAKLLIKSGEENLENHIEKGVAKAELEVLAELKSKFN